MLTPVMIEAWVKAGVTRCRRGTAWILLNNGEPLEPILHALRTEAAASEWIATIFSAARWNPSFGGLGCQGTHDDAIDNREMKYLGIRFPDAFKSAVDKDIASRHRSDAEDRLAAQLETECPGGSRYPYEVIRLRQKYPGSPELYYRHVPIEQFHKEDIIRILAQYHAQHDPLGRKE